MSRKRSIRRALIGVALFVLGVNLVGYVVSSFSPTPGGPASSSYATAPDGLAAYAELLARSGRRVVQTRSPVEELSVARDATVILLDPEGVDVQRDSLIAFVEGGGRLIAGGSSAVWTEELLPGLEWSSTPVRTGGVLAPSAETRGVSEITTAGTGSFSSTGAALPVAGNHEGALAAVADLGEGTVVLIADGTWLQNARLDQADNAALALGIAGEATRPVVFVESVHGYTEATGLAALPDSWKWALGLGSLAALVMIAARARRIGPPDELHRALPPPRAAYVDAVAGILARTGRRNEALAASSKNARTSGSGGDA